MLDLDLKHPEKNYKAALRTDLRKAANHGCTYIKAVLDNPAAYGVRKGLLPDMINVYFDMLWDKKTTVTGRTLKDSTEPQLRTNETYSVSNSPLLADRLEFQVLDGPLLQEQAWINFRGNRHCEHDKQAPLFRPRTDKTQVFVNHPAAAAVWRHKLASFFARHAHKSGFAFSAKSFFLRLRRRGRRNMEMAAELLGRNVPYYTVTVE